ncbi:metallo-beta-lactamase class B [Primorskyibacter sedentarius]|uniref:Metallo-beta-lactamase class B n=1 Tax=Primorskyibacter sedentarius TaxID=745311 RepID=A0A4R3JFA9_9RHOB|nr:MBL fold metallo-hydrolase [Primorskyibacter sedentarius]TCS64602.1 metallo-beta-lactamase class B [Primorskyibacter sedentarius]
MKRSRLFALLLACSAPVALNAQTAEMSATDYQQRALELAGDRFLVTVQRQCGIGGSAGLDGIDMQAPLPATQLADDFYFVGLAWVGAYALNTPEGIILIDSLNTPEEVKTVLVPGLQEFGLNPEDIRKVIITHEHSDHYGGAKYLRETYGAEIITSPAAWHGIETGFGRAMGGEKPERQTEVANGGIVSLGGAEVQAFHTPGHTAGTISLIVPVTVDGAPHKIGMWGGTGLPRDVNGLKTYVASLEAFHEQTEAAGVDMELSNHPFVDGSDDMMELMRATPDAPNPLVIGVEAYQRYEGVLRACAMSKLAEM